MSSNQNGSEACVVWETEYTNKGIHTHEDGDRYSKGKE